MKKKIVVYVLMAFIALFLIFRFVSISNNISLQRGIVRSVSATEHNDIVIELENDSFYYINRGMESEINYEWFQNYLPGHEIELYIQNEHLFGSNSNRIVTVSINDSCIYKKWFIFIRKKTVVCQEGDNLFDKENNQHIQIRGVSSDGCFFALLQPDELSDDNQQRMGVEEEGNPIIAVLY